MKKRGLYQKIVSLNVFLFLIAIGLLKISNYWKGTVDLGSYTLLVDLAVAIILAACISHYQVRRIIQSLDVISVYNERDRRMEKLSTVRRLAAGTADRIRNPLTTIKGFAFLLQNEGKDSKRCWRYTNIILREVAKIERIVNNFLLLSRPAYPLVEPVYINKLIDELLPGLVNRAVLHQVKITTAFDDKLLMIQADPIQIKQVITNLATNSFDAMPGGGHLKIATRYSGGGCNIIISDTGLGIPADHMEKIAEPFYTTKADAVGLGLTICHQIIINHEGSLDIETREGMGTSFRIRLPLIQGNSEKKELA